MRAACDAAGDRAGAAGGADDARRAHGRASARSARGFVYAVSVAGTTGERAALADVFAEIVARAKALDRRAGRARVRHRDARAGARRRPTPGADGVIVGSRLVRAAAEAEDAAAAVHELVARFARALS